MAALVLGATPASAVVYTIQYTGVVTNASAGGGIFGTGPLNGLTFVSTFEVDTGVPGVSLQPGCCFASASNATGNGPIRAASLKIGDFTYIAPAATSAGYYEDHTSADDLQHYINVGPNYIYTGVYSTVHDFLDGLLATSPATYTVASGDIGYGSFSLKGGSVAGTLSTRAFTVSIGGVPEPTTWGLLIVGLGLTGAVLRRRGAVA